MILGKKVLLAQDDPLSRDLMVIGLKQLGCYVTQANTDEPIEDIARNLKPDLLILDTFLPGINGMDVLKKLVNSGSFPTTKFIIVSGMRFQEVVARAMQVGADDFIAKPIDIDVFIARVKRLFSN